MVPAQRLIQKQECLARTSLAFIYETIEPCGLVLFIMRVAHEFTPEVLIEAPRRGPAVPNHDGTKALYTTSTHTIGGDTLKEVKILDISTGASQLLTDDSRAHDFTWLSVDSVAYLESGEKGVTQLKISNFHWDEKRDTLSQEPYSVAEFTAPVSQLKLKALEDGSVALAVVGRVDSDGKLFNEETEDRKSSVRVYNNFNVRYVSESPPLSLRSHDFMEDSRVLTPCTHHDRHMLTIC